MVKKFLGWAVLLFPTALFSANYGSVILDKENVLSVTDGQTFQVDIHQWQSVVGRNIEVRLRGVETPAIDGECEQERALAVDARNFVHKLLMGAETIVLRDIGRGQSAFRLIADVTFDDIELAAAVLEAELGRPSDDAKEQVWCDMQVSEMVHQGGAYSGEVLDGIPNGEGTWISPDGQQYVGQWQDGLWHGEGTHSAADGSVNAGEYENGYRNGQSTWTHPDGRNYVGEFREDQMHGEGVHTFSNGDRYAGAFEIGKQHGQGMYTFSDGSVVAGDWQDGKPWQAKYADVSEQEIGQYIDGIWYAN
jgi:hypothetical protein